MSKKIIIILLMSCIALHADRLPENGKTFQHVQPFFRWNQIPQVENYVLTIHDLSNGEELEISTTSNSFLLIDHMNWGTSYAWFVCGIFENESTPFCNEIHEFHINMLPDYFPDGITILSHDESLSQNGITVMDFESQNFSGALDENGNPIWYAEKENFAQRFVFTQFLDNGNLLGFGPGKGYEIDLDGDIIFETPDGLSLHHQISKTSKDTYFLISATVENQYCPDECHETFPDEIPWQGDIFRELDKGGNELWSWNTFDHFDLDDYNPYYVETYNGWNDMDWTHSNSIFFDENTESVFVSIRNLSRITKIDYSSQALIWNMGESDFMNETYFEEDHDFSQQHSVQVLNNGNLLFFDNHRYLEPQLSRCMEIAYDENNFVSEIVWEHVLPAELFSGSRGECDRLENGNTLITAGRTGHTLEVTSENQVVWHLEVKNMGVDVTKYRSARIPNLHPVAFSLSINDLFGNYMDSHVESMNDMITFNIHNLGWSEGWYVYNLQGLTDSVQVSSFEDMPVNINVNSLNLENNLTILNLEVYPSHAPDKLQNLEFILSTSLLLGDLNADGTLNVLDIVILANLILSGDGNNSAGDLNQDGIQNVLDIVMLVNIILDN